MLFPCRFPRVSFWLHSRVWRKQCLRVGSPTILNLPLILPISSRTRGYLNTIVKYSFIRRICFILGLGNIQWFQVFVYHKSINLRAYKLRKFWEPRIFYSRRFSFTKTFIHECFLSTTVLFAKAFIHESFYAGGLYPEGLYFQGISIFQSNPPLEGVCFPQHCKCIPHY